MWRRGHPFTLLVEMQTGTATMENSREIPLKIRNKTTIQPNNPILGIYPEETIIEKDTCTSIFIAYFTCTSIFLVAVQFTIARIWRLPRCSQTDEWIRKLCLIFTMQYYSSVQRNAFESVLMRWMNLKSIISEVSQREKNNIVY